MAVENKRWRFLIDANLPPVFRVQGYTAVHDCPVIFVRIGNLRRGPLLAKFESVMHNLIQALNNGDKIIEIA